MRGSVSRRVCRYTNITQAPGTSVQSWIDFEGLQTNIIDNVVLDGIYLRQTPTQSTTGGGEATCLLVKGQYRDCEACDTCSGLTPIAPDR